MKCIFNQITGLIYTFTNEKQNHVLMMDNWPNTDFIDVDFIPNKNEVWDYYVDINTKKLTKK